MKKPCKKVFVHGLGQTPKSWDGVLRYLKIGEKTICIDISELINFKEKSSYDSLYSLFFERIKEEDIDLLGLSLGGILALNYAIDRPEKVKSLVLIATQYKMPKRLLKLQNIIFQLMPDSKFEDIGLSKSDFINLSKSMDELDFSNSLHMIKCPVLIICGNKDRFNARASKAMANIIPNSELRMINGVGHEVNIEAPDELAEILNDFYSKME